MADSLFDARDTLDTSAGAHTVYRLDRVAEAGIPVDIVYEQGEAVLGLEPAAPLPPATR